MNETNPKIIIDHKFGNTLDNRKENLRRCTQKENARNSEISIRNKSGYKGVTWSNNKNKWRSRILVDRKEIFLGYFNDPKEAYQKYCEANKKYYGEFGRIE